MNDLPLSRSFITGLLWAYGFCGGIAYVNWCRPPTWDCIAVLPLWGLSGLILFGIAVIPLEALLVIGLRKHSYLRRAFAVRNAAAMFVAQVFLGAAIGEILILLFGAGAP